MSNLPLNTLDSIRQRRTLKVISDKPLPIKPVDNDFVQTLIESAYFAPHHYPSPTIYQSEMPSPLPWRFYVLPSQTCRQLAAKIAKHGLSAGKIVGMLNSADYLIQSTWCPLPSNNLDELFSGNLINMEHIAASGAAIQNILLTATALGHENYWSSGGVLRDAPVKEWLAIPAAEILLGAVFIFPTVNETNSHITAVISKRRDCRGDINNSFKVITW